MERPDSALGDRCGDPADRDAFVDDRATARATVDDGGLVTGWSEGACRLTGYPADEVVGRGGSALLADDAPLRSWLTARKPARWHGTGRLRRRDGTVVTVRALAHRMTSDEGQTEWLIVSPLSPPEDDSVEPEGAAETAEDAGREPAGGAAPDDLAELTLAQSPCAMGVFDTRLRLRRANDDLEHALGLTVAEMRGLRFPEIVPGPEGEETERLMRLALQTGEEQHLEQSLRVGNEVRIRAWALSIGRLRTRDGRPMGVMVTAHDTTRQYGARQRLLLLNEASIRIGSTLDVVRTAEELVDVAVPDLADFSTVDLLPSLDGGDEPRPGPLTSPVTLRHIAYRSVGREGPRDFEPGELAVYPEDSPPAVCLTTGQGVRREVTERDFVRWEAHPPRRTASLRPYGIHSTMAVPLRARGTTLGVATFSRHRRPEPFEEDDLLLAEEMTARAAVCIDNARRYTRERETALTLQRSLLPQALPRHAAVEAASRYLPAGSRAGVGGDWFDVIPLSSARVALVVGDVVGHGVQASATMGRLRTAVRTLADVDLPPDELLTHLDELVNRLSSEPDGGRRPEAAPEAQDIGSTCLYAVYDPVSRLCTLARAGHPVPALVRPDGVPEFLDLPAGAPLGMGNSPFESVELELPEGSLLALYTDGLIDSQHRDVDEALDRLRSALAQPAASLEATCEAVLGTMLEERPTDDVALLIARTRALDANQVASWDLPYDPAVVGQVRKDTAAQLAAWGLEQAIFTTELVVSELVTNAIRHAEPPIKLRLIHDQSLICEVSDASSTAPHLRRARMYDEGGRGLLLVAQLTQSWGTRHTRGGKTIWAEQVFPL